MVNVGILIDGGAGRIIASIPAILKYIRNNPEHKVKVFCNGWSDLLWGIPEIESNLFSTETANIFETQIKDCEIFIHPEPYSLSSYFNQRTSLVTAFDEIINNTKDHEDLEAPQLILSKTEKVGAQNAIEKVKEVQGKEKTIIFQPFGRSISRGSGGEVYDPTSRSINPGDFILLAKELRRHYNVVFFGEKQFYIEDDTYKFDGTLREFAAIISAADYFIGCDSVGQHMARALNKFGTVILGSTFADNVSYPGWFHIFQKHNPVRYSPIRLSGIDSHLADRRNEVCMEFTNEDIDNLFERIQKDIQYFLSR